MPGDNRQSFKLEARGTLVAGVADRHQTASNGELLNVAGVLGTASGTGAVTADIRLDGTVLGTLTIPAGATEGSVDIPNTNFGPNQTVELAVTAIGATPAGADLDVTVVYTQR